MAFVVRRTTKAGSLSTALVESYRDEQGRPRQRHLANLHGELTPLEALAKLALSHDLLLGGREEEHAEPSHSGAGFVLIPERALIEHNRRMLQIERQLAVIERDMAAINKHCTASDDEFEEAVQCYRKEYCELFERAAGLTFASKQVHAALRRKGFG
jgi:hypothetical protein